MVFHVVETGLAWGGGLSTWPKVQFYADKRRDKRRGKRRTIELYIQ